MPRSRESIERKLALAQVAIGNALNDPELQTALAAFGYTDERLRQGAALRDHAWALYQQQKGAYGDLFSAKDARAEAQQHAHNTYMRYVVVARVAFKHDRGALQKLGLAAQRKRSLEGWLAQARQFYANARSDQLILDRLNAYGITQSMLEAGERLLDAVTLNSAEQQQRKGSAQHATYQRDVALSELDEWMSDFMQIARVALDDRPSFLEKLGVTVR